MIETAATSPMPAFPYKFAGKLDRKDGKGELYLAKDSELIPIAVGQVLGTAWRIEAIGADRLQVTYVPGGQTTSVLFSTLVGEPAPSAPGMVADAEPSETSSGVIGGVSDVQPARSAGAAPGSPAYAAGAVDGIASRSQVAAAEAPPKGGAPAPGAINAPTPSPTGTLGSEAPRNGTMPTGPTPASTARLGL